MPRRLKIQLMSPIKMPAYDGKSRAKERRPWTEPVASIRDEVVGGAAPAESKQFSSKAMRKRQKLPPILHSCKYGF